MSGQDAQLMPASGQHNPAGLSAADRFRVLELRSAGLSVRAIAAETGFSKSAVGRAVRAGAKAANRAAEVEGSDATTIRKRRLAADRQARARQRRRAAAEAERAAASQPARPVAAPATGADIPGELEPPRKARIILESPYADNPADRLRDGHSGESLMYRLPGTGAKPASYRTTEGYAGHLNRGDARRQATGQALAKGLDSWGMFAVVVIDPKTGRRSLQTGLDPDNDADIARVSQLTGIPTARLKLSARRRNLRDRLSAGVIVCPVCHQDLLPANYRSHQNHEHPERPDA
jgi:hypothetical protein